MRGRHTYKLTSIMSVRYRLQAAPQWFLPFITMWVTVGAFSRGVDLAVDPSTSSELFAYANIIGANAWGWIQAAVSGLLLIMILSRWTVGILGALILSTTVWFAYSVVIFQAVAGVITIEGGLRNGVVPLITAGVMLAAFLAISRQLRNNVANDRVDM